MKSAAPIFRCPPMLLVLGFALLLSPLGAAEATTGRFPTLLEKYYQDYVALYPIDAAASGDNDPRYEDVWPNDISAEFRAKVVAWADLYLGELAKIDRASLSASEQLSYDTLRWSLQIRREGTQQRLHLTPVNQFSCPVLTFAQMASGSYIHPFKTPQDYRHFLSRARGFSTWVDTAIANMREGVAEGIVQPRALMEKVLPQLEPLMVDDPEKNILFGPLKQLPAELDPEGRVKLSVEYGDGIRTLMLPAYRRLHAFIKDEYLPHCRATAGIGALPGGLQTYAYLIRQLTTTDLTADQLHQIGLKEVARIRREMERVQTRVGFEGTLSQFLEFVASDARFTPFTTDEEVLAGYRAIEARVMVRVPQFFGRVPRTKFEIRTTEKFRAASASVEYTSGTADGSRPGVFYVPIVDPAQIRTSRMEDLFLHEAIPGHHFQLSLALENATLPRFRRFNSNTAYVEGWALYTESLGTELGMYTDSYQYLGMLLGDMHRAVRLVVDTGLHAKGWTRERALDYNAEQEGGSPGAYVSEIERYMAMPGQALSYKVGQLKIRELRTLAEKELGPKFDVRAFHDEILAEGALPLGVLDARLRDWISHR